mmetsp:Transcript_23655/g.36674  ORF Transcript_23655/g.36674 Transcript_23655/m.36674 type:complete len:86 (-) Transcript_23655:42-299(-)
MIGEVSHSIFSIEVSSWYVSLAQANAARLSIMGKDSVQCICMTKNKKISNYDDEDKSITDLQQQLINCIQRQMSYQKFEGCCIQS